MPLQTSHLKIKPIIQSGVSLIEMVVFIVVVSIALLALVGVYRQATITNVDPIVRTQALEAAQSKLDEILALKYDEQTPTGGIPACSSAQAGSVPCGNITEDDYDDVDDYNARTELNTPKPGYTRSVSVRTNTGIKVITVSVTTPTGETILLSAERANF